MGLGGEPLHTPSVLSVHTDVFLGSMEMDLLQRFEAYIASDKKIEPKDWMPDAYRKNVDPPDQPTRAFRDRRCMPEGNWISRAPSLSARPS